MPETPNPAIHCGFTSVEAKREAVRTFLRKYGDELPAEAIEKAVSDENLPLWTLRCNPADPSEVVSGVRYEHTDWYACTIKNLATAEAFKKKGLGREVTVEAVEHAKGDDQCHLLLADITFNNKASKAIVEPLGFKPVSRFCWAEGQKPADVLHYVLFPPDGEECKKRPA